jgi:glutathione synthase/RimK-type ligase-like ATP-grasp enzyme
VGLSVNNASIDSADVHAVWYRRPKPVAHIGRGDVHERAFAAAEWTAAIEGFLAHVPVSRWINHPSHIMGASSKLEQLARAAQHGLDVPSWLCTSSRHEAIRFSREQDGRIVAKPLYCGYIEREASMKDTVIYTSRVSVQDLEASGANLGAPTLFQKEVTDGADVRITLVDDDAVAVRLTRDDGGVDIRRNNMAGVRYSTEGIPNRVQSALHSLVRSYGLRFAAIDMMVTQGDWYFLEINPNGQWAWLDLLGGAEIYRSFLKAFGGRK